MSGAVVAFLGFAAMLGLIAIRMPVGLAMWVVGTAGYVHFMGVGAFMQWIKTTPYHLFANFTLSVIPLFILMGAFAEKSGLSTLLFRAAAAVVGHRRGGLAMGVIGACTAFGAICGSSVATTATFGRAALPELDRYGYAGSLSTGTIAVGGTLGILIPPSVILVVYAISTDQNIAKLFMAALIPGLLAALSYCIVIAIVVRRNPSLAPLAPRMPRAERIAAIMKVWPALLIAITVVGGIYGGVFTPTEGASVGCVGMLVTGLAMRTLGWAEIKTSLIQTAETSAMIFAIILGAEIFNGFLVLSQVPNDVAAWMQASGLSPYKILILMLVVYVILGALMDELAMILLTLPIFFPIIAALDFGMTPDETAIWFGILVLIVVGIGLTAPPIGLNVFVISALAKRVPISETYRGVLPFIAADIFRLALITVFPGICLMMVRWLS